MASRACHLVLRAISAASLCQSYRPFDERFAYLFNSYYVSAGPRQARPQRGLITRPGAAEVAAYRAHVDAAVAALIETADDFGAAHSDHRNRAQSRATASGIAAHRHPARLLAQRDASGLRSALAMAAARCRATTAVRDARRHSHDRPRRRRLLFRQRTAGASGAAAAGAAGAARWSPMASGSNSWPTAATRRRRFGCRTAGRRSRRKAGTRPAIGAKSTAPGLR